MDVQYPANCSDIAVAVGATRSNNDRWWMSCYGPELDLVAPGEYIYSCWKAPELYVWGPGTSASAPFVSGLASLIFSYRPFGLTLTNDDVEAIMKISVRDLGAPGWDQYFGFGRIDCDSAFKIMNAPYIIAEMSTGPEYSWINGWALINKYRFIGIAALNPLKDYKVKRYEIMKWVNFPYPFISPPHVWGRHNGTIGYSINDTNYTVPYCEPVLGGIENSRALMRTYVYQVWDGSKYKGCFPCSTNAVQFACAALGKPNWIRVAVKADFEGQEGGWIKVNGSSYPSGYTFVTQGNNYFSIDVESPQTFNSRNYYWSHWSWSNPPWPVSGDGKWSRMNTGVDVTYTARMKLSPIPKWEEKVDMDEEKCEFGCATLNNRIYVIGGEDEYSNITRTVYSFNKNESQWTRRADLIYARYNCAAVTANNGTGNYIYVIGGLSSRSALDTVEKYDPVSNQWSLVCNMPIEFNSKCVATVVNNRVLVFGVRLYNRLVVREYSPIYNIWLEHSASLTSCDTPMWAVTVGNRVFLYTDELYGQTGFYEYKYNENPPRFEAISYKPDEACCAAAAVISDRIYAMGSGGMGWHYANVQEYYPSFPQPWRKVCNMHWACSNPGVATIGNDLYAVGGEYDRGFPPYVCDKTEVGYVNRNAMREMTFSNNGRHILRDDYGGLNLTYNEIGLEYSLPPLYALYKSTYDNGQNWNAEPICGGRFPAIAVTCPPMGMGNRVATVFLSSDEQKLIYSFRELGSWAPPCTLYPRTPPIGSFLCYSPPSISMNNDTVQVAIASAAKLLGDTISVLVTFLKFQFDQPGSFSEESVACWTQCTGGEEVTAMTVPAPSVAIDYNNWIYLSWHQPPTISDAPEIYYGIRNTEGYWFSQNITQSADSSSTPCIDVCGGNVSIVWQEKVSANNYAIVRYFTYIGYSDCFSIDTIRSSSYIVEYPTISKNYVLWQETNETSTQILGRVWDPLGQSWSSIEYLSGYEYSSFYPHSEVWQTVDSVYFFSVWTKVSADTLALEYKLNQVPTGGDKFWRSAIPYYYIQMGDSTPFTLYRDGKMVIDSFKVDYGRDSLIYHLPQINSLDRCKIIAELYCPRGKSGGESDAVVSENSDISEVEKGEYWIKLAINNEMNLNLKLNPGLNRFQFWVPEIASRLKNAKIVIKRLSGEKVYCHRVLWEQYKKTKIAEFAGGGSQASESNKIPLRFYLNALSPNPFAQRATIEYGLAQPCKVRIKVYDVLGRVAAVLKNKHQSAGIYKLSWDAKGLANGVYFIELEAGKYLARKKIIRLE